MLESFALFAKMGVGQVGTASGRIHTQTNPDSFTVLGRLVDFLEIFSTFSKKTRG